MTFKAKGRREELNSYIWFHGFCFAFFHSLFFVGRSRCLALSRRLPWQQIARWWPTTKVYDGWWWSGRGEQREPGGKGGCSVNSCQGVSAVGFLLSTGLGTFYHRKDCFLNWFLHLSRSQQLLNHSFLRGFLFCRLLFKSSLYRNADLFSVKSDLASVHYLMLYK